jgi:hypothetical protein
VTIGMNLRRTLSSTMLAFAMAAAIILVPMGASADTTSVCNTASANGQGGNMIVNGQDPQAPVHNSSNLSAKSNGNVNAAMHSRALSLCSVPTTTVGPPSGGDGGQYVGT